MRKDPLKERAYKSAYYAANRERSLAITKAYYAANRDRILARSRAHRAENAEKLRAISRRKQGLPEPARPEPEQCECCGNPPGKQAMHLDHCHKTGAFRGWLCGKCNAGIGLLGDNIAGLKAAIAYLERAG